MGEERQVGRERGQPDGREVASAGGDQTLRIWNPTTGTETRRFGGLRGGVYAVEYHPSGQFVAVAAELTVLEAYLPPAADEAAIEKAIAEAIAETGATSSKDMGRVMKAAMARLAGQSVDGKVVNELVRKKLAGA